MSDDVLFTLTSAHLDTGMRGIPVGTCRTSKVDPIKGVSYVGHPIADLAFKDPEEVAFLLLEHHLPSSLRSAAISGLVKASTIACSTCFGCFLAKVTPWSGWATVSPCWG